MNTSISEGKVVLLASGVLQFGKDDQAGTVDASDVAFENYNHGVSVYSPVTVGSWTSVNTNGTYTAGTETITVIDRLRVNDFANGTSKIQTAQLVDGATLGTGDYKNVLYLMHGNTVVAQVDMARFAIDGMVDSVYISSAGYLVITFNTEAGKQPINIPLTDIFDPDAYYEIGRAHV